MLNSVALTLSFDRTTLAATTSTSDPVTPVIVHSFGAWAEKPFWAIVMVSFLACGATVVNYVSRIIYSMAREGNMPPVLKHVAIDGTPRPAIFFTVFSAGAGLLLGLNNQAVATIIAFGTGGLYAMFTMTTGVGLYSRLSGRWDPSRGQLKLGRWGLPINVIAFHWSLFEFINIAWPRPYAVSPDAPWWQLWAVPLVLGSILGVTTLYVVMRKIRRPVLPKSSS